MAIKSSGPLGLDVDIANEFGGNKPHSLSEYYRGAGLVPSSSVANPNIPASGPISMSNFYGGRNATFVTYQIIGGGGGGGYGLENGGGSGRAPAGGNSTLSGVGVSSTGIITAIGGLGGNNGANRHDDSASRKGQDSVFGPGGAAIGNGAPGNNAPAASYGAGGGGAGGDSPSTFDSSGNGGDGGFAGTYLTETILIAYGTELTITIGTGGAGGTGGVYDGGRGANGFCRLEFDGKTVDFTSNATYILI
jgi:hypothetical protein